MMCIMYIPTLKFVVSTYCTEIIVAQNSIFVSVCCLKEINYGIFKHIILHTHIITHTYTYMRLACHPPNIRIIISP